MTADDARKLTAEAKSPDTEAVKALLRCWSVAIETAARDGKTSVRESSLPTLRMPIRVTARHAAHEELKRSGFTVRSVNDGPNEFTHEVSW